MKILHLEDNARDAQLIQLWLQEEWPDCAIQVAATRADFEAGLAAGPDLVLSDFNIPGYNGLDALQLVRGTRPGIPFIFLSGTIGEERGQEALRAGAAACLLKDKPEGLIPAVREALKARGT